MKESNYLDRTAKKILDTLSEACHLPIRDICILDHDNDHFKAYVHGTSWYDQSIYDKIIKTWKVKEENISIERAPKDWWPLGSTGYIIKVKYEG